MAHAMIMSMMILAGIICTVANTMSVGSYVESIESVRSAVCAQDGDTVMVAIISEPIFLKSDRDKLMESIAKKVADEFGFSRVIVSMDTDVYYLISRGSDGIPEEALSKAVERGSSVDYRAS